MIRILSILALVLGANLAQAAKVTPLSIQQALLPNFKIGLINWEVGQKMDHNITVMGMNGSMSTEVTKETEVGYWLTQNVSIMGRTQKIESHISKEDGTVLELIIDGQKQDTPTQPEMEILDMHEDNITVPAGAFDCTYAKLKDVSNENISELWINTKLVPINGMIKMVTTQQGFQIQAELVSFKM